MSNKWTKWKIGYGVFLLLYFVILVVLKYFVPKEVIAENIIDIGISIFILLLFVSIIIWVGVEIIKYYKSSINSIHSCGDNLFDDLDSYNRPWGESKEHYQDMINAINFYYKKGGKVDTVVGNDLKRLYNRLEFLERGLIANEHLITCVVSVGLSICASLIFEYISGEHKNEPLYIIAFIFIFLAVVLFRYFKPIYEGSTHIDEYELKLLKEKITNAEEKCAEVYYREDILLTKRNTLNELIYRCSHAYGKKKTEIEKDIQTISKLNLNIKDTYGLKELQFQIGKKKRVIVMFLDEESNWANEQYEILYGVLRKYDLISEVVRDDKK